MAKKRFNKDNEGEGSQSGAKGYNDGVADFLKNEDPSKLGRQAAQDIEKDEDTYRKAEQEGKSRIAEEDPELKK